MVGNDTIHTVTRKEHDCIGYMDVPKDVYWGIHTQRALGNFTVSRIADSTHPQLMRAYATVKRACAEANDELGLIATTRHGSSSPHATTSRTASSPTSSRSTCCRAAPAHRRT